MILKTRCTDKWMEIRPFSTETTVWQDEDDSINLAIENLETVIDQLKMYLSKKEQAK